MPISPENRARYPDNWNEIRKSILDRAGNRCEWCGVRNHAWGIRTIDGDFVALGKRPMQKAGHRRTPFNLQYHGSPRRVVMIVLTIAHIDNPDPADVRPENLAALCQRCHNRHDAPMRRANAAQTRRARMAVGDLFAINGGQHG